MVFLCYAEQRGIASVLVESFRVELLFCHGCYRILKYCFKNKTPVG